MSLPVSEREKFRERQKLKTYREYTRNLTSLDANAQMEAETDYLEYENQVLFQRLTNGDSKMLDITPDNYRILGRLAKALPARYRGEVTVMQYDDLIKGYDFFQENPPAQKKNQIPLEVEQQIVDMALENLTWGAPHILHSMRNLGFLELQEHHVRTALSRNHIPIAAHRAEKGLSWRDFAEVLNRSQSSGVIFK
jgi:hypothetical protein